MKFTAVKKTDAYTIYKKRSGHYCVRDHHRQWLKGEAKDKALLDAKLIDRSIMPVSKGGEEAAPAAEAAPAEGAAEEK
jgi:hypothetical protein